MSYIARDRCEILEEYEHSVHADVQMPAVVRLKNSVRRTRQKVKFSRVNILARDRNTCQFCGRKLPPSELTYDHVIPRAQGGKTEWTNIVAACGICNAAKGNRTPAQAEMKLLHKPERPSWIPLFNPRLRVPLRDVPEAWKNYWTIELDP
jgi:5-methylcytosine-specific restriction endonuclease McrA